MTRTRIKICGINTVEMAQAAVDAGADAVGLVFVAASPRNVTLDEALHIVRMLPPMVEPVGLFVDQPGSVVLEAAAELGLRTVQLHGRESPTDVEQLAPLRIVKALPLEPGKVDATLAPWRDGPGNLAAILWDAPPADGAALTGGAGRPAQWSALAQVDRRGLPAMILAGGLDADNVAEAIRTARPYAVDVSSGVEAARGVKDSARIAAFCAAVRLADVKAGP